MSNKKDPQTTLSKQAKKAIVVLLASFLLITCGLAYSSFASEIASRSSSESSSPSSFSPQSSSANTDPSIASAQNDSHILSDSSKKEPPSAYGSTGTGKGTPAGLSSSTSVAPYNWATSITVDSIGVALGSAEADPGEPYTSPSGVDNLVRINFSLTADAPVEPKRLLFRAELPPDSHPVSAVNEGIEYKIGGPGGPDEAPVAGKIYYWAIFQNESVSGTGKSISFYFNPSKNGITPNGTTYPIKVKAFDAKTMTAVSEEATNSLIIKTNVFTWDTVRNLASPAIITSTGSENIPDLDLSFRTSPNYPSQSVGVSFTKEVSFSQTYPVPLGENDEPLILIAEANLQFPDGTPMVKGTDYTIDSSVGGYITKFTVHHTVTNPDPDTELSLAAFDFKISGAKFNKNQIVNVEGLPSNSTRTFKISPTPSSHSATPLVAIDPTGTSPVPLTEENALEITFQFKNELENGKETETQARMAKNIIKIGATDTSNTNPEMLAAFAGDTVVYQLGKGFRNYQKGPLSTLVFEEIAGNSYQSNEMVPISLTTGVFKNADGEELTTASLAIIVAYNDGTPDFVTTVPTADLSTSQTISIPQDKRDKISKITYSFTDVDSKLEVDTPPTISYQVLLQSDLSKNGLPFNNKAYLRYTYPNPDDEGKIVTGSSDASISYTYKDKPTGIDGRFSSNKTGANLNGGAYPLKNEVLLFTITVKNENDTPWSLGKIADFYTKNLSVYNGNTVIAGNASANAIESQYLQPGNITNMVLWDPADNTQVAANQSVFTVSDDPENTALTVQFSGGFVLQPKQTLKLTYTMNANDELNQTATIGNKYTLFSSESRPIADGEFWWTQSHPGPNSPSHNKFMENAMENGSTVIKPLSGDVVLFTIQLGNNTTSNWEAPLVVDDRYSENMEPYTGLGLLNPAYERYAQLDPTRPLNMAVLTDSMPSGFDPTDVTVTLNPGSRFRIDLGANTLAPGETVQLIYTLKIRNEVKGGELLTNNFDLYSNEHLVSNGRTNWTTDAYASKKGVIGVVKSAHPVNDIHGLPSDLQQLVDGNKVQYKVDVANYHTRAFKETSVLTIMDTIPTNMIYSEDITINKVTVTDEGEVRTPIPPAEYTLSINPNSDQQDAIKIIFTTPQTLTSELVDGKAGKPKNRLEVTYICQVDTTSGRFPPLPAEERTTRRSNLANIFFKESPNELVWKSGNLVEADSSDLDGNPDSQSVLGSEAAVFLYNEKNLFIGFGMTTTKNPAVNLSIDSPLIRSYRLDVYNYSMSEFPAVKILDLLPLYETVDTTQPITVRFSVSEEYPAIYQLDTFTDSNGKSHQRMVVTGYQDSSGDPQPLTARKIEAPGASTGYSIFFTTVIDGEKTMEHLEELESDIALFSNSAALYIDPSLNITLSGGATPLIKPDDNPADDWDSDPSTALRYEIAVHLMSRTDYVVPFVDIKGLKAVTSGGETESYIPHVPGSTIINPGDIFAWDIHFGNSFAERSTNMKAGTQLAIILPEGLTYAGYTLDSSNNPITPDFFTAPPTTRLLSEGRTLYLWTLANDMPPSTDLHFAIRSITAPEQYATYSINAYLIPPQANDQRFFRNTIKKTNEFNKYSYMDYWINLDSWFGTTTEALSHVVNSEYQIDVFGDLGVSSELVLSSGSGSVSSKDTLRILSITDRKETLTYTMNLNVEKADKGFDNVVLINRLPAVGDKTSLGQKSRDSEAEIRLNGSGSFSVIQKDIGGTHVPDETLTAGTDYVVEYFTGPANELFTDDDWKGTPNATRWMDTATLLSSGSSFQDATAIRVRILDHLIPKGFLLSVSYQAKLINYTVENKIAYNSFGFSGYCNKIQLNAEPLKVGVRAPVVGDRATILKNLKDNTDTPLTKLFPMNLIGKDDSDVEQFRQSIPMFSGTRTADGWSGSVDIGALPEGLTYSIDEPLLPDFEAPVYAVTSQPQPNGTMLWSITVTNTPVRKYQVLYDANGGINSQTDPNSPYQPNHLVTVLTEGPITRSGYSFKEWTTSADGTGTSYQPNDQFLISADVTLYAQWEPDSPSSSSSSPPSSSSSPPSSSSSSSPPSSSSSSPPSSSSSPPPSSSSSPPSSSSSSSPPSSSSSPPSSSSSSPPSSSSSSPPSSSSSSPPSSSSSSSPSSSSSSSPSSSSSSPPSSSSSSSPSSSSSSPPSSSSSSSPSSSSSSPPSSSSSSSPSSSSSSSPIRPNPGGGNAGFIERQGSPIPPKYTSDPPSSSNSPEEAGRIRDNPKTGIHMPELSTLIPLLILMLVSIALVSIAIYGLVKKDRRK